MTSPSVDPARREPNQSRRAGSRWLCSLRRGLRVQHLNRNAGTTGDTVKKLLDSLQLHSDVLLPPDNVRDTLYDRTRTAAAGVLSCTWVSPGMISPWSAMTAWISAPSAFVKPARTAPPMTALVSPTLSRKPKLPLPEAPTMAPAPNATLSGTSTPGEQAIGPSPWQSSGAFQISAQTV